MVTMRVFLQLFTRFRLMAIIVSLVLSLVVVTADGSGLRAESEEVIPDENDHLTLNELRWCIFESARLDGESDELDSYAGWEVDSYNAHIYFYNDHCSNRSFYERDEAQIKRELTLRKRQTLQELGASRVREARADREKRRVYVNDEVARILSAPEDTAAEIGREKRWGELIKTGRIQGPWYEVEWQSPSLENALTFGWVLGGLLEPGSGEEARFRHCEARAGRRAQNNEILRTDFDLVGSGQVKIDNGVNSDSYVKIIRNVDNRVVSVFVEKRREAVVKGISSGSYEIAFATGTKFSQGCKSFSVRGAAQRFDQQINFGSRTTSWELTLYSTSDGNARTSSMSYDDFDRL